MERLVLPSQRNRQEVAETATILALATLPYLGLCMLDLGLSVLTSIAETKSLLPPGKAAELLPVLRSHAMLAINVGITLALVTTPAVMISYWREFQWSDIWERHDNFPGRRRK